MAGHVNEFAPVVGERVIERQPASLHSRQAIEAFLELTVERGQLGLSVGSRWIVQLHQHAPSNLISEILMFELVQAPRQHGRTGHQYNRQRSLHDQQPLAGERGTIASPAARRVQGFRGIGTGGKPCRNGTKNDSRYQG